MKKATTLILIFIICLSLNSCQAWLEFDMKRISYVFIFTLVIGLIGLIANFINNKKN